MTNELTKNRIKFLSFSDVVLWDVKRYLGNSLKGKEGYITLKSILTPLKEQVSHEEVIENKYQIISKINFSGSLFLRDFDEIKTYKGSLYLVPKNAIIFSKINARHGCIYFHQEEIPFVVSNEYPVFMVDLTKVNGEYLKQYLRSSRLKEHLNSKTTGISKARIKSDEFLSIPFPLKPIETQQLIIDEYFLKIERAKNIEIELKTKWNEFINQFKSKLGIETKIETKQKGISFTRFFDLEKWGYAFAFSNKKSSDKYPTMKIENICSVSSGGTPLRSNKDYYTGNIPWIKTGEVVNDVIFDTEEKISELALKESSAKLFPKGSLIIAMYGQGLTRGRTAKLGIDASTNQACAVLSNIKNEIVLTDFLWIYLMNEYDNLRAMASGNSQPNLNLGMISNYRIQIPLISNQQEIIKTYTALTNEIKKSEEKAELSRTEAIKEFEQEIFKN